LETKVAQYGILQTGTWVAAMERANAEKEVDGEYESECLGYCVALETFYVGTRKGVGRIYQQTVIDTYAKAGFAKLYDTKTPITAAEVLKDRVVSFFGEHEISVSTVLTEHGTEYSGNPEAHEYEFYLAVENIDHTRIRTRSPQTNAIFERFNKTLLTEFYQVAMRRKLYRWAADLQTGLDVWMREYNSVRTHQGRWCCGKTPMQTLAHTLPLAKERVLQVARPDTGIRRTPSTAT
jgi:hypothetical protein